MARFARHDEAGILYSNKQERRGRMFAKVIVDIAHAAVDRAFTYRIPEGLDVRPGHHVLLPFGQGDHIKEGFVLSVMDESGLEDESILKDVLACAEPYTVLLPEQLALAEWMQEAYHCLLVDALRAMIPAQLRGGRIHEKRERIVFLSDPEADFLSKSHIQKDVVDLLKKTGQPMSVGDIRAFLPNAGPAITALLKKGVLSESSFTVFRRPGYTTQADALPVLTAEQAAALNTVDELEPGQTALLYGVTGSGKTEVYLRCIEQCLQAGKGAIVLVPEIALTPQTVGRFSARFGDRIAVLHSRLSPGERFDEWRRIRLGKAPIVIGARSAIFAPVEDLGLIIIDEEHESSYQSETAPRYHALDIARRRIRNSGGKLLLGSATPSLLSYYRALSGSYRLIELKHRVGGRPLPTVSIADMRAEFLNGNNGIFSSLLLSKLGACLKGGHQAMLFLNRRGYSTFVSCRACGYVLTCDNCDISMTYHKTQNAVRCHYCGAKKPLPPVCPNCGKPFIKYFGVGTEQVEEQIQSAFPGTTTLRMDADTVARRDAYDQILSDRDPDDRQGTRLPQRDAGGCDRRGYHAELPGLPQRRTDLPTPHPGIRPGRSGQGPGAGGDADLFARSSGAPLRRVPGLRRVLSVRDRPAEEMPLPSLLPVHPAAAFGGERGSADPAGKGLRQSSGRGPTGRIGRGRTGRSAVAAGRPRPHRPDRGAEPVSDPGEAPQDQAAPSGAPRRV